MDPCKTKTKSIYLFSENGHATSQNMSSVVVAVFATRLEPLYVHIKDTMFYTCIIAVAVFVTRLEPLYIRTHQGHRVLYLHHACAQPLRSLVRALIHAWTSMSTFFFAANEHVHLCMLDELCPSRWKSQHVLRWLR